MEIAGIGYRVNPPRKSPPTEANLSGSDITLQQLMEPLFFLMFFLSRSGQLLVVLRYLFSDRKFQLLVNIYIQAHPNSLPTTGYYNAAIGNNAILKIQQ